MRIPQMGDRAKQGRCAAVTQSMFIQKSMPATDPGAAPIKPLEMVVKMKAGPPRGRTGRDRKAPSGQLPTAERRLRSRRTDCIVPVRVPRDHSYPQTPAPRTAREKAPGHCQSQSAGPGP
jgi:hypothetical protein